MELGIASLVTDSNLIRPHVVLWYSKFQVIITDVWLVLVSMRHPPSTSLMRSARHKIDDLFWLSGYFETVLPYAGIELGLENLADDVTKHNCSSDHGFCAG